MTGIARALRRNPSRWCTPLGRWVAARGASTVAANLGACGHQVSPSAVYSWVRGDASPRPPVARALVRESGGALTLEDLFGLPPAAPPGEG